MAVEGEVRQKLAQAAQELAAECRAATWRDLAERAQVGYLAARRTTENMERAGQLVAVGFEKRAHSVRWMRLYEPGQHFAPAAPAGTSCAGDLDRVTRMWARR